MNTPTSVVIRDCVAILAILLCVASAAAQAQSPVLASYRVCAVSEKGACALAQAPTRPCSASSEREGHLLWAVAMHRRGVSDAGIALRPVKPVTVAASRVDAVVGELRTVACSH